MTWPFRWPPVLRCGICGRRTWRWYWVEGPGWSDRACGTCREIIDSGEHA